MGSRSGALMRPTFPAPAFSGLTVEWRLSLPVLQADMVTLREVRVEDAPSLFAMLSTEEVARFISPPPATLEGFVNFIEGVQRQRLAGTCACYAVVPGGTDVAIGLFQVRAIDATFGTAEWGFALGSAYWGTGLFMESAGLVLDFAFETIGAHRIEARAAVTNGRGNGALRKLGAVQEGVLRRSFFRGREYHDQLLWAILAEDWRVERGSLVPLRVH
jgi:RimJ/RimL family protein N-acetyltransferase